MSTPEAKPDLKAPWRPVSPESLPAYGELALFYLPGVSTILKDGNILAKGKRYPYFVGCVEYAVDGWGKRVPLRVVSLSYKTELLGYTIDLRGDFSFQQVSHWCPIPGAAPTNEVAL